MFLSKRKEVESSRNISVVWRFLAAYLAVVLLVILLASPIYRMIPDIIRDNMLQRNESMLVDSCQRLESYVKGTMAIPNTLNSMQEFRMLKLNAEAGDKAHTRYLYYLGKVKKSFSSQLSMLDVFDNGFLLFSRSWMCVMSHIPYLSFDDCLEEQLDYPESVRQELLENITNNRASSFHVLPAVSAGKTSLSRKNYLTILVNDAESGTVMGLLINESTLKKHFCFDTLPVDSFVRLEDVNGRVLFECGEAVPEENSALQVDLSSLGCRLHVYIPTAYFDNMVRPIAQKALCYGLLALLAGLVVSVFLSFRSARPIRRIASRFTPQENAGDEYRQIIAGIEASSQMLDHMRVALDKNTAHMRTNLFARLVYGMFLTDTDREEALRLLPQLAQPFQLVLLKLDLTFNGEEKINADHVSLLAYEYLKSTLGTTQVWTQLDKECIAMLLPEHAACYAHKLLESFSAYMDHYGVCVICGISDSFTGTDNVDRAYRQARLRQHIIPERKQGMAGEASEQFDLRILSQVYEAMYAGNREDLADAMDSVIQMASSLSWEDAAEQYAALRCVLRCALHCVQRDLAINLQVPTPPAVSQHMAMEACYRDLANYADEVLEHISQFRSKDDAAFVVRVCDYIDEHYDDPELGADTIVRAFSISRSQLYSLFQQNCTRSIAETIRQVRMEHAHTLLVDTELKVSDIAMRCGYNSVNTFCRAFKKHFGVSPNVLRSNHS